MPSPSCRKILPPDDLISIRSGEDLTHEALFQRNRESNPWANPRLNEAERMQLRIGINMQRNSRGLGECKLSAHDQAVEAAAEVFAADLRDLIESGTAGDFVLTYKEVGFSTASKYLNPREIYSFWLQQREMVSTLESFIEPDGRGSMSRNIRYQSQIDTLQAQELRIAMALLWQDKQTAEAIDFPQSWQKEWNGGAAGLIQSTWKAASWYYGESRDE